MSAVANVSPWARADLGGSLLAALFGIGMYMTTKKEVEMSPLEKTFRKLVVQLIGHVEEQETKIEQLRKELSDSVSRATYDEVVKDRNDQIKARDAVSRANESLTHANEDWHKRYRESEAAGNLLRDRVRDLQARIDRSKRNPNRKR